MHRVIRTSLFSLCLAIAAAVISVGIILAGALSVSPAVVASGSSPFAGCTVGAQLGSVLYVNSEEEPRVAVNPANASNIITVWQQDRWSDGGAHGLVAGVSHDGGATWNQRWAHFSTCAGGTPANGGDFERSSDPWVSFSPNGVAHQISLSVSFSTGANAVLVSRSTDGAHGRSH